MAILKAQCVLRHSSGLARDNVVNTFHFSGDPDGGRVDELATELRNMYGTNYAGGPDFAIGQFLAHSITTVDVHIYETTGVIDPDTGFEVPSGPPIYSRLGETNYLADIIKQSPTDLPAEVAICLSYQATPGPGLVQRRRRGRVYFGPWNAAVIGMVGQASRPTSVIRDVIADSFQHMLTATDPDFEFVVYSRPYAGRDAIVRPGKSTLPAIAPRVGVGVGVDQLWIDDEFDTQRRRGLQRTGRTLITAFR